MTFDLQAVMQSKCPNLWHDLLSVGQLVNGQIVVPDASGKAILDNCNRIHGLGDVVAIVAQPVARALDAVLGTNLQNCGGCAKRQATLNAVVPFKK